MKVALLGSGSSIHTVRWVNGLVARGHDVLLISQHKIAHPLDARVRVHLLKLHGQLGYFLNAFELRRLLSRERPDVLNAHYASGYGTLARLSGFRPLLLSIWGSDVYDFPTKSPLHRWLIQKNLKEATAVASISHCMLRQANALYSHPMTFITPFGVDEQMFSPGDREDMDARSITIGTVKSLAPKYGIDTLIRAFAKVSSEREVRLEIVGKGEQEGELRDLAIQYGVAERVNFRGYVRHEEVPDVLREFDIYAALSRYDSESFGVAILEAGACGIPVVVSDADGPKEVTIDGETGFVVPREGVDEAARAMARLVDSDELRAKLGGSGRQHVLNNYTWSRALDAMESAYRETSLKRV